MELLMTPRPHQDKAFEGIKRVKEEGGSPLTIMATGTGKTGVIAMSVLDDLMNDRMPLIIAHRGLLLDQIANAVMEWTGLPCDREQGSMRAYWNSPIILSTPGTLKGDRLAKAPKTRGSIYIDEAHRAVSPSMFNIYEHFGMEIPRIGLTATGDRPDGIPLSQVFTDIPFQYSLAKGIKDGYLCKIIGRKVRGMTIDLSDLRLSGEDFTDKQIEKILEEQLVPIAHNLVRETKDRKKVLIFMPSVKSSEHMARVLQEMGESADYVAGERKDDNGDVFARFHSGEIEYMAACQLVTEGYDEPGIDCVAMLRPTLSRILYSQAIGRGTRIHPGKTDMLLLEFTYNSSKHKLVSPFELICDGMSERIVEEAEELAAREDGDIDFMEDLTETMESFYDIHSIVDRATRTDFEFQHFNPIDIGDLVGVDMDNTKEVWFNKQKVTGAMTEAQRELLSRYMIATDDLDRAAASSLISGLVEKKALPLKGEATRGQMAYLASLYPGKDFSAGLTKAAASLLISSAKEKNSVSHTY